MVFFVSTLIHFPGQRNLGMNTNYICCNCSQSMVKLIKVHCIKLTEDMVQNFTHRFLFFFEAL